jgi:hypothetical protein
MSISSNHPLLLFHFTALVKLYHPNPNQTIALQAKEETAS